MNYFIDFNQAELIYLAKSYLGVNLELPIFFILRIKHKKLLQSFLFGIRRF